MRLLGNKRNEALLKAAFEGHPEKVRFLLEEGADVDYKDNDGHTALIYAAIRNHKEVVQLLLTYGADVDIKANSGWTALDIATRNWYSEIIDLLNTKSMSSMSKLPYGPDSADKSREHPVNAAKRNKQRKMGFLGKLFKKKGEGSHNLQHQAITTVSYYLAGVLIVLESEPLGGKAALVEKVLNSRCDRSGNCTLRSAMDSRTEVTVLFDKRLAHLSKTEADTFGFYHSQTDWRLPVNLKDELCQHSIGEFGWFLELWQRKMGIFDKLFKKKKETINKIDHQFLTLYCPQCRQKFIIGKDSIIVTDEDVIEGFFKEGGKGIISITIGTPKRKPDLVMIYNENLSPDVRKRQLEKIRGIKNDLQNGRPRSWKCDNCRHEPMPNDYPSLIIINGLYAEDDQVDVLTEEDLINDLKNENADIRRQTAKTLGETGSIRAVEPLITAMKWDLDQDVRTNAIKALGMIGDSGAAEPLVLHALREANHVARRNAVEALRKMGKPTVELLITALSDETLFVRESAAKVLGEIGDPRAVEPLISVLRKDWGIYARGNAAKALGEIGDAQAVEPLKESVQNDPNADIRQAAKEALAKIKKK